MGRLTGGQMSGKPGYSLHLVSVTQIIIDSVSAVINSSNVLHFLHCSVLLNASHLFAITALGGRKRTEDQEDTHLD